MEKIATEALFGLFDGMWNCVENHAEWMCGPVAHSGIVCGPPHKVRPPLV